MAVVLAVLVPAGVSCGRHSAASCQLCPDGKGAARCNGECAWQERRQSCELRRFFSSAVSLVAPLVNTTIFTPWPAQPFKLACPNGTTQENCDRLSKAHPSYSWLRRGCFEPEPDTAEVLTSFLLGCREKACSYVDIGCNIGYFAAQAVKLGVRDVDCYEPTTAYTNAIQRTRELNNMSPDRFRVHNAAVAVSGSHEPMRISRPYVPCNMVSEDKVGVSIVPVVPMRKLLRDAAQPITLLKIDIDYNEGALLHAVVRGIHLGEVAVDTIVIEMGDSSGPTAWQQPRGEHNLSSHPRHGDVADIYKLQHVHGYDVYRLNIHVGREVYNWQGHDLNTLKVPQIPGVEALHGIRSMRKLERVLPSMPLKDYPSLFCWGASFLITRVQLAEPAVHHHIDLDHSGISLLSINRGNPAIPSAETAGVSCGHHLAASCQLCPSGKGAAWCNGECVWREHRQSCEPRLSPV